MSEAATTDRWFHDEAGRLVVFQRPNPPLIVWLAARLAGLVVKSGWALEVVDAVGFGALFTWAWLEVSDGSSRFRRVLGGIVMVGLVAGRVRG